MLRRSFMTAAIAAAVALSGAISAQAQERFITLASTTSTENSGLFKHILPIFTKDSGIEVRVVAVGTGQAMKIGQQGDADALLVHDTKGELKFVEEGYGFDRRDVMYNDFVLIGPKADPAKAKGGADITAAMSKIAKASAPFASRGDDSGTHRAELRYWKDAGITAKGQGWYRELGSGMGATLNTAAAMNAYVVSDRATWANFKNRQDLEILVEGDNRMKNPYGSILIDTKKLSAEKAKDAKIWHEWLTGVKGQAAVESFRIAGDQVFFPQAKIQ